MSTTEMPATEASVQHDEQELANYELAYHVLPTVAEGEVSTIRDAIIDVITQAGGTTGEEEKPQRVDLAYEIIKSIEDKNRRFTSAYFGWVRFTISPEVIATITEELALNKQLLRHLLIRLNKAEVANPFYYHEAIANEKTVTNVDDAEAIEPDIDPNADVAQEEVDTSDVASDTEANTAGTDTESAADAAEDVPKTEV